jgi:hypothetical protein
MLIEPVGLPRQDHVSECGPGLSMPRLRSQARSMLCASSQLGVDKHLRPLRQRRERFLPLVAPRLNLAQTLPSTRHADLCCGRSCGTGADHTTLGRASCLQRGQTFLPKGRGRGHAVSAVGAVPPGEIMRCQNKSATAAANDAYSWFTPHGSSKPRPLFAPPASNIISGKPFLLRRKMPG